MSEQAAAETPVRNKNRNQTENLGGRPKGVGDTVRMPQLLAAMLYVSRTTDESRDRGLRSVCRRLLKDKPGEFIKQLGQATSDFEKTKLEAKRPAAAEKKSEAGPAAPLDEGDQALQELIGELLGGFAK